jgi:2-amino-4-hydroxy-6-hydroxymethyldihydropteridine diphosphokinase
VPTIEANRWDRYAIVALGSNLGDSLATLRGAVGELQHLSSEPILGSSIWRSTPVNCPPGSPPFLNAVVALVPAATETPENLLTVLQSIESRFGRKPKSVLNEPRPLDLDLISFGPEIRNTPALILPHPRAHQRRFVLAPLVEIAPDLVLPNQQKTVRELLENLRSEELVLPIEAKVSPQP